MRKLVGEIFIEVVVFDSSLYSEGRKGLRQRGRQLRERGRQLRE